MWGLWPLLFFGGCYGSSRASCYSCRLLDFVRSGSLKGGHMLRFAVAFAFGLFSSFFSCSVFASGCVYKVGSVYMVRPCAASSVSSAVSVSGAPVQTASTATSIGASRIAGVPSVSSRMVSSHHYCNFYGVVRPCVLSGSVGVGPHGHFTVVGH